MYCCITVISDAIIRSVNLEMELLNCAYQHSQFSHFSSPGRQLAVQTAATTIRTAFAVEVAPLVMF